MNRPTKKLLSDKVTLTEKQRRGARLLDSTKKYLMFYGSSRSGKTFLICYFIRSRARRYPGSRHLICRFSFANAKKTVWIQTLYPLLRQDERKGLCKIDQTQGIARYKNGSVIMLGGLEPSRIDSVLAAEYGTIFVTEANENRWLDVEMLFSRLNDTAVNVEGKSIPLKFIADLNPTIKNHWTNVLFRMGLDPETLDPRPNYSEFAYLHFKAEDNEENLAEGYIDSLKALSPGLRKRFYEGEFGAYEGLVYQIDETVHIVDDFDIPEDWEKGRAVDFGYTHPFGTLWGAMDKSNETLYIYREYYKVKKTVNRHCEALSELTGEEKISFTMADHDAEDRATMNEHGIHTFKANKSVLTGIDRVTEYLEHTPETTGKKTNIKIFRSCKFLITEFYSYKWKESATLLSPKDREVVKEDDHLMDCLRYLVMRFFPDNRSPGKIFRDGNQGTGGPSKEGQVIQENKELGIDELSGVERTPGAIFRDKNLTRFL